MIFITVILAGVFYVEAQADVANLDELQGLVEEGGKPEGELVEKTVRGSETGNTNENDMSEIDLTIEQIMLTEVSCTLTWQDDGSSYFRGTNDPDYFKVSIQAPNGEILDDSDLSSTGSVTATARLDYEESDFEENYVGTWAILVEAGECGDDHAPGGFRTTSDTGNEWTLSITYIYEEYQEETEEG